MTAFGTNLPSAEDRFDDHAGQCAVSERRVSPQPAVDSRMVGSAAGAVQSHRGRHRRTHAPHRPAREPDSARRPDGIRLAHRPRLRSTRQCLLFVRLGGRSRRATTVGRSRVAARACPLSSGPRVFGRAHAAPDPARLLDARRTPRPARRPRRARPGPGWIAMSGWYVVYAAAFLVTAVVMSRSRFSRISRFPRTVARAVRDFTAGAPSTWERS